MAQLGARFEGLLLADLLAPLSRSLGEVSTFAIAPLAQSIATHDTHGFGALLATALSRAEKREPQ